MKTRSFFVGFTWMGRFCDLSIGPQYRKMPMSPRYKGFVVEISSSESSGTWQATAKIIPTIAGMQKMKGLALLITGGFNTQADAETEALTRVKQKIDETAS